MSVGAVFRARLHAAPRHRPVRTRAGERRHAAAAVPLRVDLVRPAAGRAEPAHQTPALHRQHHRVVPRTGLTARPHQVAIATILEHAPFRGQDAAVGRRHFQPRRRARAAAPGPPARPSAPARSKGPGRPPTPLVRRPTPASAAAAPEPPRPAAAIALPRRTPAPRVDSRHEAGPEGPSASSRPCAAAAGPGEGLRIDDRRRRLAGLVHVRPRLLGDRVGDHGSGTPGPSSRRPAPTFARWSAQPSSTLTRTSQFSGSKNWNMPESSVPASTTRPTSRLAVGLPPVHLHLEARVLQAERLRIGPAGTAGRRRVRVGVAVADRGRCRRRPGSVTFGSCREPDLLSGSYPSDRSSRPIPCPRGPL